MYKAIYIEPGSKKETELGQAIEINAAKALACESVVGWVMRMFQADDVTLNLQRDPELWRPLAEDIVKIAWIEDDGVIYGEGYNGGSIILPPQRFIRIEVVK